MKKGNCEPYKGSCNSRKEIDHLVFTLIPIYALPPIPNSINFNGKNHWMNCVDTLKVVKKGFQTIASEY